MILEQMTQSKFHTVEAYRKLPFLNYSSIKMFDENRNKFYRKCILKEKLEEEKTDAMIFGDLVDCILFTPEDFEQRFVMLSVGVAPNGQMKALTESLWKLTKECLNEDGVITREASALFEEAFNSVSYDRNGERVAFKGKKMEDVLETFMKGPGMAYLKVQRDNYGKDVIDTRTRENAERLVQELYANPVTAPVLNIKDSKRYKVFKQLAITFKHGEQELKALCDLVIVDMDEKTIWIYDLKCTGWGIESFEFNIIKNRYYLQWSLYFQAVTAWAKQNGYEGFDIMPMRFIVVSTDPNENPLIYTTNMKDLECGMKGFNLPSGKRRKGLSQLMEEINWHQAYGIWNMSYDDYQTNGVRPVKLFEE